MVYDVIIIGAGVGGLTCALKLSTAGKKVLVLEKQPIPGGFATSFTRKGFVFESSLHCVNDLGPEGEIREQLGDWQVAQKVEFIDLKEFCRIIYPDHDFIADFNHEHFKDYLKQNFPQEEKGIQKLFACFDKFYLHFQRFEKINLPSWLRLLLAPFLYPSIIFASCLTAEQFIARFIKDKKLIAIITDIWRFIGLPQSRLSALYFLVVYCGYYYKRTSFVKGGFHRLFAAMVEKIRENGSEVKFNSSVKKINALANPKLKSVTTQTGEFQARAIVSNANPIDTMSVLIDDPLAKEKYSQKLSGMEKSLSAFQVYLGLKVPARNLGMNTHMVSLNTTYDQDKNFAYCSNSDYANCPLSIVDHAQIDSGLVPAGKGNLLIITLDSFAGWNGLDPEEYKKKKIAAAAHLIGRVEKYLPGLTLNIEIMEAATPRTMSRYGCAVDGAIYGFSQTVSQAGINRLAQNTPVKGLFLAGAWTFPGAGFHGCFISGIQAADLALRFLK